MGEDAAKLTLGPVLFNWGPEEKRDFYFKIADEAPLDIVHVGEVVCSKRAPFFEACLPEVVARLERAGKEVVHSTLALIMSQREMEATRAMALESDLLVEANDISAAALLAGRPHAIGPFVNVYNEGTLAYLVERGAGRVCLPVELPAPSLAVLASSTKAELEVQVFGRLPLAISARCYHARARKLHKDDCRFVCGEDADGMDIETLDGEPFLAVNGTQVLSYRCCNLLAELTRLREMGIRHFRLSPQFIDMVAVARAFRAVIDGNEAPQAAGARLKELMDGVPFCDGFFHGLEGAARSANLAEVSGGAA